MQSVSNNWVFGERGFVRYFMVCGIGMIKLVWNIGAFTAILLTAYATGLSTHEVYCEWQSIVI